MRFFCYYFWQGAVFNVKCMGTCSQTAIANGEFGLSEGLATASGDMSMQGTNRQYEWRYTQRVGNRQSNWRVPMARGCMPSPARAGMAVQKEADAQGAGQIVTPIGGLPCTGIASMAGGLLLRFEKFHPLPL